MNLQIQMPKDLHIRAGGVIKIDIFKDDMTADLFELDALSRVRVDLRDAVDGVEDTVGGSGGGGKGRDVGGDLPVIRIG